MFISIRDIQLSFSSCIAWSKLICFVVPPSLCLCVTCPSSQRSALFSCTKEHTSGSVKLKSSSKVLHGPPLFLSHPPFSLLPIIPSRVRSSSSPHQWSFPPHLFVSTLFSSLFLTLPPTIPSFLPKARSLSLLFISGSSSSFARPLFPPPSKDGGKSTLQSAEPPASSPAHPHATPHVSPFRTAPWAPRLTQTAAGETVFKGRWCHTKKLSGSPRMAGGEVPHADIEQ